MWDERKSRARILKHQIAAMKAAARAHGLTDEIAARERAARLRAMLDQIEKRKAALSDRISNASRILEVFRNKWQQTLKSIDLNAADADVCLKNLLGEITAHRRILSGDPGGGLPWNAITLFAPKERGARTTVKRESLGIPDVYADLMQQKQQAREEKQGARLNREKQSLESIEQSLQSLIEAIAHYRAA